MTSGRAERSGRVRKRAEILKYYFDVSRNNPGWMNGTCETGGSWDFVTKHSFAGRESKRLAHESTHETITSGNIPFNILHSAIRSKWIVMVSLASISHFECFRLKCIDSNPISVFLHLRKTKRVQHRECPRRKRIHFFSAESKRFFVTQWKKNRLAICIDEVHSHAHFPLRSLLADFGW